MILPGSEYGKTLLELDKLRLDGGTQPREGLDENIAREYGEAMRENGMGSFDPITVFYDGSAYWLADGFHRVAGAKLFGISKLRAIVEQGTRRDAVLFSVGANARHGLRRTNADKRRSVTTLLKDEEWSKWSDREIARWCGVAGSFVGDLRKELSVVGLQMERTVTRNGTTYTQDTAGINANRQPAPEPEQPSNNFIDYGVIHRLADPMPEEPAPVVRPTVEAMPFKWYPVHYGMKLIFNHPFDSRDQAWSSYYRAKYNFESGSAIQLGTKPGGLFADYTIADPLPDPNSLQSEDQADAEAAARAAIPLDSHKWYPVRHIDHLIYNDPFDSRIEGENSHYNLGCVMQSGSLIIEAIQLGGNYARYTIVNPRPAPEPEPEPEEATDWLITGLKDDYLYPVEREYHTIFNDPFSRNDWPDDVHDYYGHKVAYIFGHSINNHPRFTGWLIAQPCKPVEERHPKLWRKIIGGMWFPCDTTHRIIYNDPRYKPEDIPAPYKAESSEDIQTQWRFDAYQLVESAIPKVVTEQPAQLEQPAPTPKPGSMADLEAKTDLAEYRSMLKSVRECLQEALAYLNEDPIEFVEGEQIRTNLLSLIASCEYELSPKERV